MYNNLNNKEREQVKLGLQCIATERRNMKLTLP